MSYANTYYDPATLPADGPETFLLILIIFAVFVVGMVWLLGGFESCPKNPFPKDIKGELEGYFTKAISDADSGLFVSGKQIGDICEKIIGKLKSEKAIK